MHRLLFQALILDLLLILLLAPSAASAQDSEDRRERISENLKYRFEQLREASVAVVSLEESDTPGLSLGTLLINGQNQMRFLVNGDDTKLYLLAADAVDVSMTVEELADQRALLAQAATMEARQRHARLVSLAQGAPSLGPADAPVTIIEFSDFQCPYCAQVVPTVKDLLAKYPDQVRLVFMDLPLSIHPWAQPAAIAAGCAARQSDEAFWGLHDYYFANQDAITEDNVMSLSAEALSGTVADLADWENCATDTTSETYALVRGRVQMSMRAAQTFGASGTPAFFINGRFISGAQPLAAFEELVQQALTD